MKTFIDWLFIIALLAAALLAARADVWPLAITFGLIAVGGAWTCGEEAAYADTETVEVADLD